MLGQALPKPIRLQAMPRLWVGRMSRRLAEWGVTVAATRRRGYVDEETCPTRAWNWRARPSRVEICLCAGE